TLLPAMPRHASQGALPAVSATSDPADAWNSIALDRDGRGHYRVQAAVNGVPVAFMIDTGASDVVLSPADATRLGLRPDRLRFTGRASTANGEVALAPVSLREIRIGQLTRRDIGAVVNGAPMPFSLLGMSFLASLEGWEARGDRLLLYW
ncbi:MAG: TIGR02281 family clan AA aspartic protease, partial [Geminicoccaceae bacterium]